MAGFLTFKDTAAKVGVVVAELWRLGPVPGPGLRALTASWTAATISSPYSHGSWGTL